MFDVAVLLACMILFLSIFMIGGLIADKLEEVFMYTVRFINENGKTVTKVFSSAYQCRLFIQKARHSKRISLLSYPNNI